MKNILLTSFFFLLILSIGIPLNVDAQTSRTHSVIVSSDVSSVNIPLVGTLTILMKYSIDFDVRKPSIIEAGTTEKITLSPRNGVLTTTFFLNGNVLATIPKTLALGSSTTFAIPVTVVGEVYGSPSLLVGMGVNGPSSPSDYVRLNSMSSIDFPIRVNNEIGNSDSVTVFFPMRIDLGVGGNINLVLTNIPIQFATIPIEVNSQISETIPLRKYYTTSTSLDVKDGSKYEYVKVKPNLSLSSGQSIPSGLSVQLKVDGATKTNLAPNVWSNDIYIGSGSHNFQASFSDTYDQYNKAKIYKSSSSNLNSFLVKAPPPIPKQTEQPQKSFLAVAEDSKLKCGTGTHEENGYCVADNTGDDFFSSVLKGIEGFFKSIFG